MNNIVELPDNLITPEDRKALDSFGAHEIARGRATRFHWDKNDNDDPVFEIYKGGSDETLALSIRHNRTEHRFEALSDQGKIIVHGTLDHIMAHLDEKLAGMHGENTSA